MGNQRSSASPRYLERCVSWPLANDLALLLVSFVGEAALGLVVETHMTTNCDRGNISK
jgi:hypothetical protein